MQNASIPMARPYRRLPLPLSPHAYLRAVQRRGHRYVYFDAREVPRIWAQNKYACFIAPTLERQELWIEESLHALEARLRGLGFVRVHRSTLVNLRFLQALERLQPSPHAPLAERCRMRLELRDGEKVAVSRRYMAGLKAALMLLTTPPSVPVAAVLQARASVC